MIWAGPLLLAATASAATPVKVASTYDEAACDEAVKLEVRADPERDCSEPQPPVPTVIDCNDERAFWVIEMIGSCDMPRAFGPLLPSAVNGASRGARAICLDGRCGVDQPPAHASFRNLDDSAQFVPSRIQFTHHGGTTEVVAAVQPRRSQTIGGGLERPPRAVA